MALAHTTILVYFCVHSEVNKTHSYTYFTEICVLYAYEVCSMFEYKKRKRLRVEAFNKILPKNYIIKNTMGKKGGRG